MASHGALAPVAEATAGYIAGNGTSAPAIGATAGYITGNGTAQDQALLGLFPTDLSLEVPVLRPDNPDLQIVVSGEKKFMIHESRPGFRPSPGDPYPAQRLAVALMDITPALLLFWEPGAGKTGAMAEVAEYYRRRYEVEYIDGLMATPIRKTVVLAINPTVRKELKRLLFCKHTGGHYFSERIDQAPTQRQQKKEITKALGVWYTFYTYIGLIDILNKSVDKNGNLIDQQKFVEQMDHTLFLCDEIHVLQQDKEVGGAGRRKDVVFKILFYIRTLCPNSKMIFATGTPINKDVSEGLSILELLNGVIMPTTFPYKGKEMSMEELTSPAVPFSDFQEIMRPYMAGRVSFMVSPSSDAEPSSIGEPLVISGRPTGLTLYYSYMSDRQTYYYLRQTHLESPAMFSLPQDRSMYQKRDTSAAHKYQIEASIFTYPDTDPDLDATGRPVATEVVGLNAYKHYIKDEEAPPKPPKEPKDQKGKELLLQQQQQLQPQQQKKAKPNYKNIWTSPKLKRVFTDDGRPPGDLHKRPLRPEVPAEKQRIIENVGQYSAVFHAILTQSEGFGDTPIYVSPGCIYTFFVTVENGIAPFCMALEALGYERYREPISAFSGTPDPKGRPPPACRGESSAGVPRIPKKLRYGVITSKTDDVINDSLRELQMSAVNADGSYIRFMVVSGMAKAGINVFHCQQIHLGEGHWAPGTADQSRKRPVRLDGFVALKALWPQGKPFDIRIFRHVAWPASVAHLTEDRGQLVAAAQANPVEAPALQRRVQMLDQSIRYHTHYIGADQDPSSPGVPPIGKLVYTRMYNRSRHNGIFYQAFRSHAIDAWPNRPLIVSRFSEKDDDHLPFEPYKGPPAKVVVDGDYYLTHGEAEIEALAKRLAAGVSSGPVDILAEPGAIELVGEALRKVLDTDPPLNALPGAPGEGQGRYPVEVNHWNQLYMPFALNYRNGLLYQQAELGPPEQMLQFYRDFVIMSDVSELRHVNAMMGEDPVDILADLRKLPAGPEVKQRLSFSVTRADRLPIPQETHVAVVEMIIAEAWRVGWAALPPAFKQILQAYRNVIFVFPRNNDLTAEIASQVDRSTVKTPITESVAYGLLERWMERPDIYGRFLPHRPVIFALDTYLNTEELRQSPVRKVIIHMLNYVTQDPSQEFGSGSVYRTPFENKRPKFPIRIYEEPSMTSPTEIRWRDFGQVDSTLYQVLIQTTINQIIAPYEARVSSSISGGGIYAIAFPNGVKRIISPGTQSGRDLACMGVDVARGIINEMTPAIKEVTDLQGRGSAAAKDMRKAIWNNLVNFGAVFFMVNWGIQEDVDFNCRRGGN